MLHCARAPFSMTKPKLSFQALFRVIPSQSEESSAWMLRFAQHDKSGKRGCFTPLTLRSSMTKLKVSFQALFRVIPSQSEESSAMWMLHCADAAFSMTKAKVSFRA